MIARQTVRVRHWAYHAILATAVLLTSGVARAQEPSAGAIGAAKELIEVRGAAAMFEPVVPGVIETAKNTYLRTNPQLSKDLNEVAAQLRAEFASKRGEAATEIARVYAQLFTEQEIKDALAFYKTPLGRKLTEQEPRIVEQSMNRLQTWADQFSEQIMGRMRAEMKKRGHTI